MADYKLHIKVGEHEFNGEGPEKSVRDDYAEWKSLIELISTQPTRKEDKPHQPFSNGGPPDAGNKVDKKVDNEQLANVYLVDPKQKLVSLKVHPHTTDRDRDAMLLIIHGYLQMLEQQDVPVGQIKQGMRQTGIRVDRVDKVAFKYVNAGYLSKGGSGKGSRYRITNSGVAKANELIKAMAM